MTTHLTLVMKHRRTMPYMEVWATSKSTFYKTHIVFLTIICAVRMETYPILATYDMNLRHIVGYNNVIFFRTIYPDIEVPNGVRVQALVLV